MIGEEAVDTHNAAANSRITVLAITAAACFVLGLMIAVIVNLFVMPLYGQIVSPQQISPTDAVSSPVLTLVPSHMVLHRQAPAAAGSHSTSSSSAVDDGWIELGVVATAYSADKRSTGKDPGHPAYRVTYTGTTVLEGRTVAVDPEIIPLGSEVKIPALSPYTYIAEDTGRLIKGKRIDIYMEDERQCLSWGVRTVRILYRPPKQSWGCNRNYL